jgi:hypothetical protein
VESGLGVDGRPAESGRGTRGRFGIGDVVVGRVAVCVGAGVRAGSDFLQPPTASTAVSTIGIFRIVGGKVDYNLTSDLCPSRDQAWSVVPGRAQRCHDRISNADEPNNANCFDS